MKRRAFLRNSAIVGAGLSLAGRATAGQIAAGAPRPGTGGGPVVISTWGSIAANRAAWSRLQEGAGAIDAVECGVMVEEADPKNTSVGYGGLPNSDGVVELDAAVMDGTRLEAGSVAALRDIKHPVCVARKVMEDTPHVLLVGAGARRFALENGFRKQNLLTPESRRVWKRRRAAAADADAGNHDTIGMVVLDRDGRMAVACTTSGLAWKLPGRVGDSPLIGHGLYCDEKAGGAAATGIGEEVIKVCGSYQVVEFMRQGLEPEEAARRVLHRILARDPEGPPRMVGFVALRADGLVGYASTQPGFTATVSRNGSHETLDAPGLLG